MLKLLVPGIELYDSEAEEFTTEDPVLITLEHSLVSLSKWESFYQKPFLSKEEKSEEEILHYIEDMILDAEISPGVISRLSMDNISMVNDYIEAPMTATWFDESPSNGPGPVVTAELIYYWMISFGIPFECAAWHLNRLLTLIKVCNIKNSKPKKMSRSELAARNRSLNAQRRAKLGSKG